MHIGFPLGFQTLLCYLGLQEVASLRAEAEIFDGAQASAAEALQAEVDRLRERLSVGPVFPSSSL
jgi:hypothetical protein